MLGDILMARGDLKGAGTSYQEALDLFASFNDRGSIAENRLSLARVLLEESDALKAEALTRQAVEEFQSEKAPDQEAAARDTLARALLAQGKQPEAVEQLAIANKLSFEDEAIRERRDHATLHRAFDSQRGKAGHARLRE
jgi:tetratricopeptide (TPR) repeat protein